MPRFRFPIRAIWRRPRCRKGRVSSQRSRNCLASHDRISLACSRFRHGSRQTAVVENQAGTIRQARSGGGGGGYIESRAGVAKISLRQGDQRSPTATGATSSSGSGGRHASATQGEKSEGTKISLKIEEYGNFYGVCRTCLLGLKIYSRSAWVCIEASFRYDFQFLHCPPRPCRVFHVQRFLA